MRPSYDHGAFQGSDQHDPDRFLQQTRQESSYRRNSRLWSGTWPHRKVRVVAMTNTNTVPTLAEMLSILVDCTIVHDTTSGLECAELHQIGQEILDTHDCIPFCASLQGMDPFQATEHARSSAYRMVGTLREVGLALTYVNNGWTGSPQFTTRLEMRADIDRALFNLKHAAHNTI